MPWNVNREHWFAVAIDIPEKAIYIVDSARYQHATRTDVFSVCLPSRRPVLSLLTLHLTPREQYVLCWLAETHHALRGTDLDTSAWTYHYPVSLSPRSSAGG